MRRFFRWLFRRRPQVNRPLTHISRNFVDEEELRRRRGRRDWYKKPPDQMTRR